MSNAITNGAPGGAVRAEKRRIAGLALVVSLSAACAPAVAKPAVSRIAMAESWKGTGGVPGESPSPELARWWQTLGDDTLSSLVERALVASPDLRTAHARLREARARRALAGKDLAPTISSSVSASTSKSTGTNAREQYSAGLDASWEPDFFGGTRQAVAASQADLLATEADLAGTQVALVAELARSYVEIRSLQARLTIARASLARQTETLELTSWRARAGLTSDLDVEQSRTSLEQTRAQIPSLETSLARAKHGIAVLVGQPPTALDDLLSSPAPIPAVPGGVAVGIPADAIRQRPDVRAAERRLLAATLRVGEARAALYPSLRLSGSLGLEAATLGGLGDTVVRSVLGSLTAPIFHRGRIRNQIEIQSAAQEATVVAWERAILTALEDVENALVSLANAERRRTSLSESAVAARRAAQMASQRYTTGLASYQTVLDTERTVLSVEDSLTSSEAEKTSALIRLYEALGGGWESEKTNESAGTSAR